MPEAGRGTGLQAAPETGAGADAETRTSAEDGADEEGGTEAEDGIEPEDRIEAEDGIEDGGILARLTGFGRALRDHGLPVGSDDVTVFCEGLAELSVGDPIDLYHSGRCTLVHRREHLAVYDEVFRRWFLGIAADPVPPQSRDEPEPTGAGGTLDVPDSEPGDQPDDEEPMVLGLQASPQRIERHKRFEACSAAELAALRRIIARIRLEPPLRRTRRRCPNPAGPRLDIRRMTREAMRLGETSPSLHRLTRKHRARPVVLILDVSGSMADHSRNLLQFAYSMRRAAQKVEAFCFGTRLTRITAALDRRNPDDAMRLAAARVLDFDGGTRIGESLDAFVRNWGRRGLSRGATVVVCSDGLDRGDPALLAEATERLSRLCHRIVWVNPLARGAGADSAGRSRAAVGAAWPGVGGPFAEAGRSSSAVGPDTVGMKAAGPWIDAVEPCGNLADLEALAAKLPALG